jgi:PASTA domain
VIHLSARRAPLVIVAAVLPSLVACGGTGAGGASPTVAVTASAAPAPAPTTTADAPTAAPRSWTMPNLVGANLQDAQDAIQKLTSYGIAITTSHDATGARRQQVLDRNWKVCDQNVPPGAAISTGTRIDFGAAKLTESC